MILVGHRGYVGSAFATHLRDQGVPFLGLDRSNVDAHRGVTARYVIDAAGSSDRRLPETDPLASFRLIVERTLALLTGLRFEHFVSLSSIAVYPEPGSPATTRENAHIDPALLTTYGVFKYLSECLVQRYAPKWTLLRLGPMVGPGLRKNSIFDLLERGTVYVSPDSTLPYLDTRDVARIAWSLRDQDNEIFNLTGRGTARIADVALDLGIQLAPELYGRPTESFDIDIAKVSDLVEVPETAATLARFIGEWRSGLR